MKTNNSAKLRRLGVSDETIEINARAAEQNRAVHYVCERVGGVKSQLSVKMAIVMTMDETYKLARDHKMHAKAKALAKLSAQA